MCPFDGYHTINVLIFIISIFYSLIFTLSTSREHPKWFLCEFLIFIWQMIDQAYEIESIPDAMDESLIYKLKNLSNNFVTHPHERNWLRPVFLSLSCNLGRCKGIITFWHTDHSRTQWQGELNKWRQLNEQIKPTKRATHKQIQMIKEKQNSYKIVCKREQRTSSSSSSKKKTNFFPNNHFPFMIARAWQY